jgi:hypothetical protein
MSQRIIIAAAAACLLAAPAAFAGEGVLAEIQHLEPGRLEVRGFYLDRAQDVRVEATGIDRTWRYGEVGGAWILDAASRRVAWDMRDADSRRAGRDLRSYDDEVHLGPGVYEVYYATYPDRGWDSRDGGRQWWTSVVRDLVGWDDFRDLVGDLGIRVRGDGRSAAAGDLERARRRITDAALVSLTGLPNGARESRGFRLDRPADLDVYAVGELGKDGGYDYGWIVDATTGKRVWTFTWDDSRPAGGADKNRVVRSSLHLPAGSYAAVVITDGSHSPRDWNAPPPHDPAFWGLTLTVANPQDRAAASTFDYSAQPHGQVVAAITKVGNDRREHTAFILTKPLDVRVYSVGEGDDDEMVDYGWIADARTRHKVWSMDYSRTEHAGGAHKNRLADEIVHLEPGTYLVSYVTDGSHAWGDWNADPPVDPDRWGITLFAASENFDPSTVRTVAEDEAQSSGVLARIAPVGDDANQQASFSLDRRTRVAIYALGEGRSGEMYDYGWLEDAGGRIVWEMTYRMTEGAGGAAKNRLYEGTLILDPGRYVVHYKSDGSHSFPDWNASPPADPEGWGIQITRADAG